MSRWIDRRFVLETVALVVLAVICATTANALASRSRKVALVGEYPKAMVVPQKQQPTAPDSTIADTAPVVTAPAHNPTLTPTPTTTAVQKSAIPKPTPPAPPSSTPSTKIFAAHPDKPFVEISGEDVWALHARKAPFFDARRTSVYEEGHIAGSRNISVWEGDIKERIQQIYDEGLNPEGPIVVYCSGGDCEDSHMLSEKLWGIGLNNVLVYRDGYPDWLKRGGAVTRGSKP